MLAKMKEQFLKAFGINCDKMTESKNGLTYLSWATAWSEFKQAHPQAHYTIHKNEEGLPTFGNAEAGYMVYTDVTVPVYDDEGNYVNCVVHEMWLPVLDFRNKAMKNPDAFAINKSVMRCLTKNLAMHGLGINVYQGEDFPTEDDVDGATPASPKEALIEKLKSLTADQKKFYLDAFNKKTGKGAKDWVDTTVPFLKQVVSKAL